jgi:HK97 family phage portal protein
MNLLDTLRKRIGNVKFTLPFIKLFGYEKVYGKDRIKDFDNMIENFKSWVYACAQRNAYSVAKCELKVYRKGRVDGKQSLIEIEEHPFKDLMDKVNPFFNKFELWTLSTIFLELTGNNYWWIVPDQLGVPREIWNLPSNWMKVIPSKTEFISGYTCLPPGEAVPIPFQVDEIIHFKYPSPFDLHYGTGPLLGAQYGVDLNNNLKIHAINYLMNNAQPSGALYTEDSLTDDQFQRLKNQWNREYRGSSNAGKMAILEKGLKYQQIGQGLADLNFPDIARSVRDEILAIFGVPASQLGLVEDVNRANAEANDYVYQNGTILPKLTLIEEKLNEKMMPRYDANIVCKFVSPVPADKEYRLKEQAEHIRSGYSSIDDERVKDNEEPYNKPETQMPLIPFSVMPAGEERPDPYAPGSEKEEDKEEKSMTKDAKARRTRKWEVFAAMTEPQEKLLKGVMARYFEAERKEVMRNLNNYRSIGKEAKVGISASIIFNIRTENDRLKTISKPYIREAIMSGADLMAKELGIDFTLIEPRVLRAIDRRVSFFSEKTNDGTVELLKDELQEAMEKGENIESISRRIDKVFDYSEHYRSVRIARTEVIGAANEGQLETALEVGVEFKQWITARDENVRESHQIEGQTVGITEDFVTGLGNHIRFPGDRATGAPAEDIINCRCTWAATRTKE